MKSTRLSISICTFLAIAALASGPLGSGLVNLFSSQSAWSGAGSFINNFSYLQILPYFLGLSFIVAAILLVVTIYNLASLEKRSLMLPGLVFVTIYSGLASLNYVLQIAFVPTLATRGGDGASILISALSMSNPLSLAWSLERFAYLFLQIALLFLLPYFQAGRKSNRFIPILLVINAVMGAAAALVTAFYPEWGAQTIGFLSSILLNLVFVTLILVIRTDLWNKLGKRAK